MRDVDFLPRLLHPQSTRKKVAASLAEELVETRFRNGGGSDIQKMFFAVQARIRHCSA